jgi:hypothetical protein
MMQKYGFFKTASLIFGQWESKNKQISKNP